MGFSYAAGGGYGAGRRTSSRDISDRMSMTSRAAWRLDASSTLGILFALGRGSDFVREVQADCDSRILGSSDNFRVCVPDAATHLYYSRPLTSKVIVPPEPGEGRSQ